MPRKLHGIQIEGDWVLCSDLVLKHTLQLNCLTNECQVGTSHSAVFLGQVFCLPSLHTCFTPVLSLAFCLGFMQCSAMQKSPAGHEQAVKTTQNSFWDDLPGQGRNRREEFCCWTLQADWSTLLGTVLHPLM